VGETRSRANCPAAGKPLNLMAWSRSASHPSQSSPPAPVDLCQYANPVPLTQRIGPLRLYTPVAGWARGRIVESHSAIRNSLVIPVHVR
jgi:hypothetical protein